MVNSEAERNDSEGFHVATRQKKKPATDTLKLATVRKSSEFWNAARCVLLFTSPEALNSVSSWVRQAANIWGVELVLVEGV